MTLIDGEARQGPDQIEGWSSPEARAEWFGDPQAERILLDAYRGGRMHHAWLIGGPKGIGKATLAYRFARFAFAHPDPTAPAVLSATDLSVPPEHSAFRKVANRSHANLLTLERPLADDGKRYKSELTVGEIRRTVSFFGSTSAEAGWRIAIVDPADDMNANAANALLKVLEEPPTRSLFFIVSHAPGRLLPTIRSRCRWLELQALTDGAITEALAASGAVAADTADIATVAGLAEGSLRRAILLLEADGIDVYRDFTALVAGLPDLDVNAMHAFADKVAARGADDAYFGFLDLLAAWLDRRVRREDEPEAGTPPSAAALAAPLESWAEVWDNVARSSALTDALNLDRKQTVLSILMTLARATRM